MPARRQFGSRMREARLAAGLTQMEVAAACKVSRQAVSSWERGQSVPGFMELRELGLLLGTSLDWLVYGVRTIPASRHRIIRDVFRLAREPA